MFGSLSMTAFFELMGLKTPTPIPTDSHMLSIDRSDEFKSHPRIADIRRIEVLDGKDFTESPTQKSPTAHGTDRERIGRSRRNTVDGLGAPTHRILAGELDNKHQLATIAVQSTRHSEDRRMGSPHRESSRHREPSRARSLTQTDQIRTLMANNEKLTLQLLDVQRDLGESRKKTVEALKKFGDLADERSGIIEQMNTLKAEALTKERAAAQKIVELEGRTRRRDEDIRSLQAKLRAAEEKHINMAKLLEVRTADLNGVQPFLTTADVYSGAEIISMVETLNGEIFQIAAYMAELIEDPSMIATAAEHNRNVERYKDVLDKEVRLKIGLVLFEHLETKHVELRSDPLPLQLAFQGLLSAWCTHKTRSFASGPFGDTVDALYSQIRVCEAQAIAGRWRAITNAQMKSFDVEAPTIKLVDMLLGVLCLCGWSMGSTKSQKAILTVQDMVHTIEKMWIQLKTATKEGITTADMETFLFAPDSQFAEGMEDNYPDDGTGRAKGVDASGKRILCTVTMGLRRTLIKRAESGVMVKKSEVFLKPKVALSSVLLMSAESRTECGSSIHGSFKEAR